MLHFKWKPWFLCNTLYSHMEASIKSLFSPLEILQTCHLKNVLGLSLLVWSYGINISLQSGSLNTLNMIKFYLIFSFRNKERWLSSLKQSHTHNTVECSLSWYYWICWFLNHNHWIKPAADFLLPLWCGFGLLVVSVSP